MPVKCFMAKLFAISLRDVKSRDEIDLHLDAIGLSKNRERVAASDF
jgi:hypothetical protein